MVESLLTQADVLVLFVVGLLAGAHCIGMCGPLVTVYAKRMQPPRSDGGTTSHVGANQSHLTLYEVRQHTLFNLGRAMSYALIGTIMGAIGAVVFMSADELTATADLIRGIVGIGIGAIIMAVGIGYVLGRGDTLTRLPGLDPIVSRLVGMVDRLAAGPGIVGLGAAHGLLPCPILYPAYLYAFATGSPLHGGIALAALGLGTIPAVFAYGTVIQQVDAKHRQRVHKLLGLAFLALGYVLLAHGLHAIGIHVPHPELPFWNPFEGADAINGEGGHH